MMNSKFSPFCPENGELAFQKRKWELPHFLNYSKQRELLGFTETVTAYLQPLLI